MNQSKNHFEVARVDNEAVAPTSKSLGLIFSSYVEEFSCIKEVYHTQYAKSAFSSGLPGLLSILGTAPKRCKLDYYKNNMSIINENRKK